MEEVHQPVSNSPYMEPGVSQPTAVFPTNQQHQQNQQTPPSLRPLNSQSNEQPSIICGFTLTELAHVTIQVAGIIIAAVFGAWAVKSYESANFANRLSEESLLQSNAANRLAQDAIQQSLYANILAIINLCLSSEQFRNSIIDCSAMLQDTRFASIIHDVISSLPTLSNTTQTVSKSSTLLPTTTPPSPTTTKLPSITTTLSTKTDLPPTMTGPPSTTTTESSTITTPSSTTTTTPPSTTTILDSTTTTPPATSTTPNSPTTTTLPSTSIYPPLTTTLSHTSTTISVAPTYLSPIGSPLHQISFGAVVGIIIAVVITVAIVCLLLIRSRRAKRSRF